MSRRAGSRPSALRTPSSILQKRRARANVLYQEQKNLAQQQRLKEILKSFTHHNAPPNLSHNSRRACRLPVSGRRLHNAFLPNNVESLPRVEAEPLRSRHQTHRGHGFRTRLLQIMSHLPGIGSTNPHGCTAANNEMAAAIKQNPETRRVCRPSIGVPGRSSKRARAGEGGEGVGSAGSID